MHDALGRTLTVRIEEPASGRKGVLLHRRHRAVPPLSQYGAGVSEFFHAYGSMVEATSPIFSEAMMSMLLTYRAAATIAIVAIAGCAHGSAPPIAIPRFGSAIDASIAAGRALFGIKTAYARARDRLDDRSEAASAQSLRTYRRALDEW